MPQKGQITHLIPLNWKVWYRYGVYYNANEVRRFFPTSQIPSFFKYDKMRDQFKCIKAVQLLPTYLHKPFKHERTDNTP